MKTRSVSEPVSFFAECACGRVAFEALGTPLTTLACYCDDCQGAAEAVEALPGGQSGMLPDGGTIATIFRRDRVRCVRGDALLIEHRLRPSSPTRRVLSSCCNCSLTARFDNWMPHVPLRSFAPTAAVRAPDICTFTKFAPTPASFLHAAPRYATLSPGFALKLALATVQNLARSTFS
ncbi:MAG: hypothetical protein JWN04_6149 [Myxococcaceae bacterium]|nr:hypothetical protein [Myxococcaceae bacterium]